MTIKEAIERKVTAGLTDLQMLVLLMLAERKLETLTDLATDLDRAVGSVSMAAQVLEETGYLVKDTDGRRFTHVYFYLSEDGTRKLAWLLGKGG